jgi:hypothetical protein
MGHPLIEEQLTETQVIKGQCDKYKCSELRINWQRDDTLEKYFIWKELSQHYQA